MVDKLLTMGFCFINPKEQQYSFISLIELDLHLLHLYNAALSRKKLRKPCNIFPYISYRTGLAVI